MKFTIDELYRIYLTEAVRSVLNYNDMLYMHIHGDNIVINNNSENAYRNLKVDSLNRIALSSEVVLFKLVLNAGDEFEGELDNNSLIIPMSDKRDEVEIKYIRRTDEYNRIVFPEYFKQFINARKNSQVEFTKCNDGFIISCGNTGNFFGLDDINRVVVPAEIAKSGQVQIKYDNNKIIVSAA